MSGENLNNLKSKIEAMNSDELIELISKAFAHPGFNPTMMKILKTYLVRALRSEGYL